MKSIFFILSSILLLSIQSFAAPLIGKIIRIQGEGHLLNNGSAQAAGPQPRLKYQGLFYTFQPVKIGSAFRPGDIIHTSANGRARVAFTNGDQITVGPSTSYQNNAQSADENETNFMHLFYGKIRSFISKRKKTNTIKVKTSTVTAGVRGTDFFISHHPTKGTEVTVLRGVVDVESSAKEKGQVKTGQTANIQIKEDANLLDAVKSATNQTEKSNSTETIHDSQSATAPKKKDALNNGTPTNLKDSLHSATEPNSKDAPNSTTSQNSKDALQIANDENYLKLQPNTVLQISETQKADLNYIAATTTVKKIDSQEELAKLLKVNKDSAAAEFNAIQALEKLSIEKVVEDVKKYNPSAKIEVSKISNVDDINKSVVSDLAISAPNDKPNKPRREELDDLGKDSYDKYFKGK